MKSNTTFSICNATRFYYNKVCRNTS